MYVPEHVVTKSSFVKNIVVTLYLQFRVVCMGGVNGKYDNTRNRNRNRNREVERLKRENENSNRGSAAKPTRHKDYSRTHSSKHVVEVEDEETKKKVEVSTIGGREGDVRNDKTSEVGNVSMRSEEKKKIASYEFVDGWPKWLVDNIPKNFLASLVAKSADSYEKLDKVGRGTYSNVYKARDKETGKIVALKKVRFDTSDSESIKFMAREIMLLQALDHPNVIKLEGLATSRMQYSLYLVFEYMQTDLTRIISRPGERLTEPQIKCYMQQLLLGLQHCHERGVMHRDIKASNLLIDKRGVLKIADFGLGYSFAIRPEGPLTNRVVTLWYRAPELLLGSTDYGYGIDLWSAGCLLAEMFVGRPIMPGRTEVEQLHMIFKLCGSPSEDFWKKMKLTTSYRPPQHYKANYEENFQVFPSSARGLLITLLDLDADRRGSAASALESEFFKSSPLACDPSALPVIHKDEDERSQTKRRRRRKSLKKGKVSQTSTSNVSLSGKNQIAEQSSRDFETSKEEKSMEQSLQGQETGNSGSSRSSQFMSERSMNASISPVFLSSGRKSPKTEGHPNALKNIKNYTLLQASIIDIINRNEGDESGQLRRSFSALDFRLDPAKLSSIYGSSKKLDHEM
ncbi:probable serine/threonine-protein kinase At1g54610 [Gastrolobium bilobum]|uniref:probable serine/threonine-protein kinase At1g54610 n=1 Tax=Gastrolobium bilobum TaxID=150636 RepID=UPI002AB2FDCD|nr:probable serine/threonine-protein kinase At1g54610 [Gastrolobium bilobum]